MGKIQRTTKSIKSIPFDNEMTTVSNVNATITNSIEETEVSADDVLKNARLTLATIDGKNMSPEITIKASKFSDKLNQFKNTKKTKGKTPEKPIYITEDSSRIPNIVSNVFSTSITTAVNFIIQDWYEQNSKLFKSTKEFQDYITSLTEK